MTVNPQPENGTTPIAHEIVEALCRTNLSPYESRFLWCVFRKTYGWHKKEDWISLSQIVEMTGMHKAHASRAKRKLLDRHIVTQTGNKIAFNKFYTQWRELPKQVTVTQTGTPPAEVIDPPPVQVIPPPPKQADTNNNVTKISFTKETGPKNEKLPRPVTDLEQPFKKLLVDQQWCDQHYADKTWDQGLALRGEHRAEFERKLRVMLNSSRHPATLRLAKKLFHEISGYVNDFGAMQGKLTPQEIEARRLFREETGQDLAAA